MGSEIAQKPAIPNHVAIIMDGNGRWAANRGLPRLAGHERGTENIRRITEAAADAGVSYLTLWAFSTENWRRPVKKSKGSFTFSAARSTTKPPNSIAREPSFATSVVSRVSTRSSNAQFRTPSNSPATTIGWSSLSHLTTVVARRCFQLFRRSSRAALSASDVTEELVDQHLFTAGTPDPDLVIRTSGEHRMSNFLLWQAAYAELHFSPVFWPDFRSIRTPVSPR